MDTPPLRRPPRRALATRLLPPYGGSYKNRLGFHALSNGPETTGVPPLELIPLGGVGEFGMNMMVVACGDTAILVDAGVMFPEPDLLGVDLIIPDLRQLQQYKLSALVLTHGHEDHIGAVPHVLPYISGPINGTALTLALVEPKLEDLGAAAKDRL